MNSPKVINKFIEEAYSFTFTIPARKKVYYDTRRRVFGKMALSQQSKFMNNLLMKTIWQEHFNYIDWVFERHEPTEDDKQGRLHIHGYALVKKKYLHLEPLYLLANSFYTHNKIIGLANSVYPRLINIQKTLVDINYWYEYINKSTENMPYKSPYNSQLFLINSLENPFLTIEDEITEVEI